MAPRSRPTTPRPPGGEHVDKVRVLNLFENPIVADLDSTLAGPEVVKGGLTLNQLVNLGVAVGQNLPYNHVMQAWNGQTGASLPAFPQAVEDYQLLSSPAVADVSAAAGKEVIVGTGLYYLRNINSTGVEGAGWPKFTGGWLFGVPAVGDVDGDGNLEVAALTREGNSFLWDTDRPACGDQRRVVDLPPRRVVHRRVRRGQPPTRHADPARRDPQRQSATLTFTAPGDDWQCGQAPPLPDRQVHGPINHPTDGTVVGDFDASAASGQTETHTVADIGRRPPGWRSSTRTTRATGAGSRRRRCRRPPSASCSGAGTRAARSAPRAPTSSAPRASSCGSRPRFGP